MEEDQSKHGNPPLTKSTSEILSVQTRPDLLLAADLWEGLPEGVRELFQGSEYVRP
jgi:hypothetical protein